MEVRWLMLVLQLLINDVGAIIDYELAKLTKFMIQSQNVFWTGRSSIFNFSKTSTTKNTDPYNKTKMGFSSDENNIIYMLSLASNALSFFGSGFI